MICKNCNFQINSNPMSVKEMMFGLNEQFNYYQCSNCNCLQIEKVPKNLEKYYFDYYTERRKYNAISVLRKSLWRIRRIITLGGFFTIINKLSHNSILEWTHISKTAVRSDILDVGCGNGDLLFEFSNHGFKNLTGIDPLLKNSSSAKIRLIKTDLVNFKTSKNFNLIIFNHSLEHISEQHKTMDKAVELLTDNGVIMIRTPVVNKAFEVYKQNWVQIDAPRHFIIHSLKSIEILCKMHSTKIYHKIYDSTSFQFLGSEQFKKNIPSFSDNSYKVNLAKSIFTHEDILMYEKKALALNKSGLGDQAAFFIRKV